MHLQQPLSSSSKKTTHHTVHTMIGKFLISIFAISNIQNSDYPHSAACLLSFWLIVQANAS
jgi:hypothetical protein